MPAVPSWLARAARVVLALYLAIIFLGLESRNAAWDAQPKSRYWVALSKTAYSITGDVEFSTTRVTFQNGKSLDIRYLNERTVPSQTELVGHATTFSTYRVTSSANPVLLNANRICDPPPTFVTVAYSRDSAKLVSVYFAAFTGKTPPRAPNDGPGFCGSFWCRTYSYPHEDNPATGIAPYRVDGAGQQTRRYNGTWEGSFDGTNERWLIDVVGGYVYVTQISSTVVRSCMIAAPFTQSPKGLILTHGWARAYGSRLSYNFFAEDESRGP